MTDKRWVLALPFLAWVAMAQQPPANPTQAEAVDKIFQRWDSLESPGCALSVMQAGQIVYKRGYGMADLDHDIHIGPDSVFHVASLSKQFTATAIVLLAQAGGLSLDDDVRKYLPELPDFGTPITIRNLIHHTSGLRDQWDLLQLAGWRYSLDLITDDDVLGLISRQRDLNFKPGDQFLYSNTGYTLLAQIVERVSRQSFRDFTEQRIFEPLGMKNTHFQDDHAEIVKRQAIGYAKDGNVFRLSVPNFDTVGPTGLLSTVEDLALWDENFYQPTDDWKPVVEQLLQTGTLNNGQPLTYAFGLQMDKYRGLTVVDHNGAEAGYKADLLRFPEQHLSVACLCNVSEANPALLARSVADIFLASDFKEPPPSALPAEKPITLSQRELSRYVGVYWDQETESAFRLTLREGRLMLGASAMIPVAENRFRVGALELTAEPETSEVPLRMIIRSGAESRAQIFTAAPEVRMTPGQRDEYTGNYQSDEIDGLYRIVEERNTLVLKRPKYGTDILIPTILDYFQGGPGSLHFLRNASGDITGFLMRTGRIRNFQFKKVD